MAQPVNNFKVGLFVLAAITLGVVTTLALNAGAFFKKTLECETYFDASIRGVATGGQVLLRGIKVGQITEVALAGADYKGAGQIILIRFSIDPTVLNAAGSVSEARQELDENVKNGLRARLTSLGVTGSSVLELDYLAPGATETPMHITWKPHSLYIPSTPGVIAEIGQSLENITRSLAAVDFGALSQSVTKTADALGQTLARVDTLVDEATDTVREIKTAAAEVSQLAKTANSTADQLKDGRKLIAESSATLKHINDLLKRAEFTLVAPQGDLPNILENLRIASDNFRELSITARDYPSQIIFGGQPPKVKYEKSVK